MKLMNFTKRAAQAGFTMIELLVVIAILGVLAVVVLGAINPLEQINRGRDTSNRADAESLISAIERYNANIGFYPWMDDADDTVPVAATDVLTRVTDAAPANADCSMLEALAQGDGTAACPGTQEIKSAMFDRVGTQALRTSLFIYNRGQTTGDSTYVCFAPQSSAFRQQARERCGTAATDLPEDLAPIYAEICVGDAVANLAGSTGPLVCLP